MPIMNTQVKGGGVVPSGTLAINTNGVHDVTNYANADVQVPTQAPAHYIEKTVDANNKLINGSTMINLNGVTDIGDYVLTQAYRNSTISGVVDMSLIISISGQGACNNMFYGCKNITGVNLSSLTTISGAQACQSMFDSSWIQTVVFSALTTISGGQGMLNAFANCSKLTALSFPVLNNLSGYGCFGQSLYQTLCSGCTVLESLSFGGIKADTFSGKLDRFRYLFDTNTGKNAPNGCTIHFPSNFDPTDPDKTFDVTTLQGYPTFGGNASYIHLAFDLPATE